MIMKRNLQQSDLMYNMIFDVAIHGIDAGQEFFKEFVTMIAKYGDSVRLVGFNTKKPTARVNTSTLYKAVFIPMEVLNQLPQPTEIEEFRGDADTSDSKSISETGDSNDEESD